MDVYTLHSTFTTSGGSWPFEDELFCLPAALLLLLLPFVPLSGVVTPAIDSMVNKTFFICPMAIIQDDSLQAVWPFGWNSFLCVIIAFVSAFSCFVMLWLLLLLLFEAETEAVRVLIDCCC